MTDKPDYEAAMKLAMNIVANHRGTNELNLARAFIEQGVELAAILKALDCHPAFIIAEIQRLREVAAETPSADDYRLEGMAIVPVEPTEAMLEAGEAEWEDDLGPEEIYRAMLAAVEDK